MDASEYKNIHVHTRYNGTFHRRPRYCLQGKGYSYLGIADQPFGILCRGLKIDDIKRQHEEINMINAKYEDFMVLKDRIHPARWSSVTMIFCHVLIL